MIDQEEFLKIKPGVTQVICRERHSNYDYGWADEMDDMLNKPLIVLELRNDSVVLCGESGRKFSFHRKIIDLYEEPCVELTFKNTKMSGVKQISSSFFENNCLSEDFAAIKKILKTKKTVIISDALLENIDKQCPRVLGVLISNNKLKKQVN